VLAVSPTGKEAPMSAHDQLLAANETYASGFAKGDLPMPPGRRFAVITCMDARLVPAKFLGLEEGDAHVIRNAGGLVTDDALRSLVISHWLLGTQEAFVIAHTDCGMLTFTNDDLHRKLADEADADASEVDFQPFADLEESVRRSVRKITDSSFLPESFTASGYVYDVTSGRLREVA
jgi:carbonic anhydrase